MTVGHPFRPDGQHPHLCGAADENPLNALCGRPERDHIAPAAAVGSPPRLAQWMLAATPPPWAIEETRTASGWRNAGERRWQAQIPGALGGELLLLVNEACTHSCRFVLDFDGLGSLAARIVEQTFIDMQDRLDHDALPVCAVPECDEKAPVTFTAAEPGPLVGVARELGEQIRFCPRHGHNVYVAASGGPIAEWLRPDAVYLDPIAQLEAAAYAGDREAYDATVARLRRLTPMTRTETA